jgi:CheY-like chemotaxis protein
MSEKVTRLQRLTDELIEAARRLGLEVRREKILREVGYRARGGPCRLRDQDLIIIDREMPPGDQLEVIAEALKERPHEQLYLSPAARKLLQPSPDLA